MFFVFDFIPDRYRTQKMCDRVVSEDPFLIVYCCDRYKTQRMCDEAVYYSLASLKVCYKEMIKNLLTALCADYNILYFNEDSGDTIFSCNETDILSINLNNINLNSTNYNKKGPEAFI